MNLARVEYYFAKFLSAMELRARDEEATDRAGADDTVASASEPARHGHRQRRRDDPWVRRQGLRPRAADRAAGLAEDLSSTLPAGPTRRSCSRSGTSSTRSRRSPSESSTRSAPTSMPSRSARRRLGGGARRAAPAEGAARRSRAPTCACAALLERFIEFAADRFPLSRQKARAMLAAFNEHGFTSYF